MSGAVLGLVGAKCSIQLHFRKTKIPLTERGRKIPNITGIFGEEEIRAK